MRQGGNEFLGACAAEASEPQSLDAGHGKVNHPGQFGCEIGRAVFAQAALRCLDGKPCGVPIGFLWRVQAQDLTEMSADAALFLRRSPSACV
jgi:hypothetical protein